MGPLNIEIDVYNICLLAWKMKYSSLPSEHLTKSFQLHIHVLFYMSLSFPYFIDFIEGVLKLVYLKPTKYPFKYTNNVRFGDII